MSRCSAPWWRTTSSQQRLLARLDVLMTERLQALERVFSIDSDAELQAARARATVPGPDAGAAADPPAVQQMDDAEVVLLARREGQAAADRQNALLCLLLTLGGAAGIFLFLLHRIRGEMRARAAADERVRAAQRRTRAPRRAAYRRAARAHRRARGKPPPLRRSVRVLAGCARDDGQRGHHHAGQPPGRDDVRLEPLGPARPDGAGADAE